MCLALPARVVERFDDGQAVVALGAIRKTVSIVLVPDARVGDYVIVHVGHAIGMIDPDEAERTLALFATLPGDGAEADPLPDAVTTGEAR